MSPGFGHVKHASPSERNWASPPRRYAPSAKQAFAKTWNLVIHHMYLGILEDPWLRAVTTSDKLTNEYIWPFDPWTITGDCECGICFKMLLNILACMLYFLSRCRVEQFFSFAERSMYIVGGGETLFWIVRESRFVTSPAVPNSNPQDKRAEDQRARQRRAVLWLCHVRGKFGWNVQVVVAPKCYYVPVTPVSCWGKYNCFL